MGVKSIGIIGAGKHFQEKIFPLIFKKSIFKIEGILRNSNKPFKKIPILKEKNSSKKILTLFIFVVQITIMKSIY